MTDDNELLEWAAHELDLERINKFHQLLLLCQELGFDLEEAIDSPSSEDRSTLDSLLFVWETVRRKAGWTPY